MKMIVNYSGNFSNQKHQEDWAALILTNYLNYNYPLLKSLFPDILEEAYLIEQRIKEFIKSKDEEIEKVIKKPKASGAIYGRNNEPKVDLKIISKKGNPYNFSIKKTHDSGYLITIGDSQQFLTIFDHFKKDIPEKLYPVIQKAAEYIKIISAVSSQLPWAEHVNKYFSIDKFPEKKLSGTNVSREELIKRAIEFGTEERRKQYLEYLHEAETCIQELFKDIMINYPILAKKLIYEFATGYFRFPNGSGRANIIVGADDLVELPDGEEFFDNDYTEKKRIEFSKRGGRLQNVPRKGIPKRVIKTGDYDLMIQEFTKLQMSFKI